MSESSLRIPDPKVNRPRRATLSRPMFPEGLLTPLLLVILVTVAGLCVQQSDWSRLVMPVAVVAGAAAAFGALIAKLRVLDSIAHLVSMALGIGLSFVLVATNADTLEGGVRERLREIGDVGVRWYLGQPVDDGMEALLVSLLMGIILWLVGYLAAWSLFRRGWIFAAIALPGFLLLVNLGYAERPETGYLAAFAGVALVLISRHSLYTRQREWNRLDMGRPGGLVRGFLVTGVVVAIVATTAGWRAPASLSQETLQPLVGEVSTRALTAQETATDWLREMSGDPSTGSRTSGSFATFGDSFSVGGPLALTDEPQALVFADDAPYLTAQRYDAFTGRGWYSTIDETFEPEGDDGRRYSPEMTFAANQDVPLSADVTQSRSSTAIEITPLTPTDGRMLTVVTFQASSVEASVRMSWLQLDEVEFTLDGGDVATAPRDVQALASLLASAELTGPTEDGGPAAADDEDQERINGERTQLRERFLDVTWTANASGAVTTLTVSGQLPVYDDVEAVFSDDAVTGGSYRVVASTSTAAPSDLRNAGDAYPEFVEQRYLSLPDTITPRTVALTESVTAASMTPYDRARAIETYLREAIAYDETVVEPPNDADIVDYVLFERERGYCEYYASSMTVMLRSIGIPARVAVGFYPGDFDQGQCPGPQPGGAGGAGATPPQVTPEAGSGGSRVSLIAGLALATIGGLGLAGWLLWSVPLRGMAPSHALFARLRRVGRWFGVAPGPSATPQEFGRAFAERMPQGRQHVDRIVHMYELDQFGPERVDSGWIGSAEEAWRSIRRQAPRWLIRRR